MIGVAPRANAFRDVQSATVRQFEVDHIGIKSLLFDSAESIGNRLACLDLTLLVRKHPLNDLKRTQLDRLYQKIVDDLDNLLGALGLEAA